MANWSNDRLVVIGNSEDVARFRRQVRSNPRTIFLPDMLVGETQDMYSERAIFIGRGRLSKKYIFQTREDDVRHFRFIAKRYPKLTFVLAYGDPNSDEYASVLIRGNKVRHYRIPDKVKEKIMEEFHIEYADEDDFDEIGFWEAGARLMDIAEAHWMKSIAG